MMLNDISQTFLKRFSYTKEPIVIIGGRLYTLVNSSNSDTVFHFLNKTYSLEESEEISQLEKQLFLQRQELLERIMSRHVQNIISKVKGKVSELKELGNIYESIQDISIERFIMVDVFNAYNHEDCGLINEVVISDYDNLPEIERMPTVEDLFSRNNSLDALVNSRGILVFENLCYKLVDNSDYKNENEDCIEFRHEPLYLIPWINLEELCKEYSKTLNTRIKKQAKEHAQEFSQILQNMVNKKKKLTNAINQNTLFSGRTSGTRGHISFQKRTNDEYQVRVTVPPYIIKKNGRFYAFTSAVLGMKIKTSSNRLMLMDRPTIISLPYKHPFVYSSGNICYGSLNWSGQRGINFGQYYNLSNKRIIAKKIAQAMREGERTLLKGYVGNSINPVNDIDSCNCQVATNLSSAKTYAQRHDISLDRIVDNY